MKTNHVFSRVIRSLQAPPDNTLVLDLLARDYSTIASFLYSVIGLWLLRPICAANSSYEPALSIFGTLQYDSDFKA